MSAALALILAALFAAAAVAVIRAIATPRAAPPSPPLPEAALAEAEGVEDRLAAAVRRATVSSFDAAAEDDEAFAAFKRDLAHLFPRVHAALPKRELGERALVYEWKGSDPTLAPVILCAHFDVVPADDAAEWRHGPFSGDIAEGAVWGRGTQDIKVCLVAALDAAERILAAGRKPRRTVYFAFGGDEEVGGNRGAAAIAAHLAEAGVRASFLLDEGGPVADGMLSFADRPLALVGIAEKGYLDAAVETKGSGGHASMPPKRSAAGDLARAVAAVEAKPSPARLTYTVRNFLDRLAPYAPFAYRLLFRNLWLTGPLVKAAFSAAPTTNALVRTTAAPTMLQGSAKENVLADRARANVNMRILPGDTTEAALERLSRLVARHGAAATV
ncbi:MAG: M20/M25/M40 family metallo-hydrolase, partial [Spirochaetaceae bacterium]|nr:M20/M25/M40 family metallo-hydrolase [Spirochaetaceae bacterium]